VKERSRVPLRLIKRTTAQDPTSVLVRRLIAFIAAVYNGTNFPFDLPSRSGYAARECLSRLLQP
jgi:hypothetical protein